MNLKPNEKNDLASVVKDLAEVYDQFKQFKKRLDGDDKKKKDRESGLKERFFDEATKAAMAMLATRTFVVGANEAQGDASARTEAERRCPGWVSQSVKYDETQKAWRVLLKEDPEYKQFAYIDPDTKIVWKKQVVATSPDYDIDSMIEEDPELWKRVSTLVRVPMPLEELEMDDLLEAQKYVYPGPLQVKLATPRKAKPEELDD